MIKAAIEKILDLKTVQELVIDERNYTDKQIHPVLLPMPFGLELNTLTGLVDYVDDCVDDIDLSKMMVQVVDHRVVRLIGSLEGSFVQRARLIEAVALLNSPFAFGRFMDLEEFIINLQACFVRSELVEQILGFISSVDADADMNQTDNGFTQQTTVKQGVSLRMKAAVPNPVALAPYRTFLEIEQPESRYIFRIKNDDGVRCALFEAGGGQWKLEAIERIKAWLVGRLPEGLKVIA